MSNEYGNLFEIRNFKLARTRDSTFASSASRWPCHSCRSTRDKYFRRRARVSSLASRNTHRRRDHPLFLRRSLAFVLVLSCRTSPRTATRSKQRRKTVGSTKGFRTHPSTRGSKGQQEWSIKSAKKGFLRSKGVFFDRVIPRDY